MIPKSTVAEPVPQTEVGVDMGLKSFLVSSDGELNLECTKYYQRSLTKLKKIDQDCARRKIVDKNNKMKGPQTGGYYKACAARRKLNAKIQQQRRFWHFAVAKKLTDNYGTIYVEDLHIQDMVARPKSTAKPEANGATPKGPRVKTRLAKSIHDAGWYSCIMRLKSTAERRGRRVASVCARGTTQTCSQCGHIPEKRIGLSVRTFVCQKCNFTMDRDLNAARNVLKRGQELPQEK